MSERRPQGTESLVEAASFSATDLFKDLPAACVQALEKVPRMARLLLERAEEDCIHDMTHKELAQHLGVHRESATAAIGELRKAGIIAVERKRIRIVQRARLERGARVAGQCSPALTSTSRGRDRSVPGVRPRRLKF